MEVRLPDGRIATSAQFDTAELEGNTHLAIAVWDRGHELALLIGAGPTTETARADVQTAVDNIVAEEKG